MIHMPAAVTGKAWKLARPYHGPYRVVSVTPTNIEARLVDDMDAESIFVAVNRVRPCHPELPDSSWTGHRKWKGRKKRNSKDSEKPVVVERQTGPVARSMSKS